MLTQSAKAPDSQTFPQINKVETNVQWLHYIKKIIIAQ